MRNIRLHYMQLARAVSISRTFSPLLCSTPARRLSSDGNARKSTQEDTHSLIDFESPSGNRLTTILGLALKLQTRYKSAIEHNEEQKLGKSEDEILAGLLEFEGKPLANKTVAFVDLWLPGEEHAKGKDAGFWKKKMVSERVAKALGATTVSLGFGDIYAGYGEHPEYIESMAHVGKSLRTLGADVVCARTSRHEALEELVENAPGLSVVNLSSPEFAPLTALTHMLTFHNLLGPDMTKVHLAFFPRPSLKSPLLNSYLLLCPKLSMNLSIILPRNHVSVIENLDIFKNAQKYSAISGSRIVVTDEESTGLKYADGIIVESGEYEKGSNDRDREWREKILNMLLDDSRLEGKGIKLHKEWKVCGSWNGWTTNDHQVQRLLESPRSMHFSTLPNLKFIAMSTLLDVAFQHRDQMDISEWLGNKYAAD
ncbi:hypothetical protein BKA69DRAFT_1066893 [Paraphysoderma sedebokerense]|nr:hypothetical protein BKA69DRAFT_1066893 [Paraphysoderma sedebokerense]